MGTENLKNLLCQIIKFFIMLHEEAVIQYIAINWCDLFRKDSLHTEERRGIVHPPLQAQLKLMVVWAHGKNPDVGLQKPPEGPSDNLVDNAKSLDTSQIHRDLDVNTR